MNEEHELSEVFVRHREEDDFGDRGGSAIEDALRLHESFLEQLSNEINLIVDIIMSMDGRFDDIRDEMECRFQEADYKFEVIFDELNALGKRRHISRK